MKIRTRIIIEGEVQIVGFRCFAKNLAKFFNVIGWTKNLSDGSVEALIEGDRQAIEQMIDFWKRNPPKANVKNASQIGKL